MGLMKDRDILKVTRASAFLVAALVLLLSGCNPAPTYVRPPAPAPLAYKEAPAEFKEGAGWKLAEPGDDKIRAKWWEMYNDPVLNGIEEQVQISNQTIAAEEASYRAAQAIVQEARAGLFPTLTGSTSYTNARSSATTHGALISGTSTGSSSVINEYSLPISVSYTLDLWHRVRNTIAADTYNAQATAADIQTALLSAQSTLAEDYFELRAVDAQRLILRDTLKNYQDALNLTKVLYKTGIDSEQDVTQAQVQFDTATAQLTDFGVSRSQYEHAIAVLIGKPASSFEIPYATFVPTPPQIPVSAPSKLLERRPDIAALERTIEADNAQIGVARAAYYPNLTLSASGGFQTTDFAKWFTWPSRFWSLGPAFAETLPIDRAAIQSLVQAAEANYDQAVANYRQTVLTSFQAVEDELAASRILADEVVQQQRAIASSQHYLDLAQLRYRTGVDSYLNVITAQNTLLSNRETEVQVQLRQMTASVSLILALGGGWDESQLPDVKNILQASPSKTQAPSGTQAPLPAAPEYNPAPLAKPAGS